MPPVGLGPVGEPKISIDPRRPAMSQSKYQGRSPSVANGASAPVPALAPEARIGTSWEAIASGRLPGWARRDA